MYVLKNIKSGINAMLIEYISFEQASIGSSYFPAN